MTPSSHFLLQCMQQIANGTIPMMIPESCGKLNIGRQEKGLSSFNLVFSGPNYLAKKNQLLHQIVDIHDSFFCLLRLLAILQLIVSHLHSVPQLAIYGMMKQW